MDHQGSTITNLKHLHHPKEKPHINWQSLSIPLEDTNLLFLCLIICLYWAVHVTKLYDMLGISPGEGNGNLLQYTCLENPMDREAWQATVHGVSKSRT